MIEKQQEQKNQNQPLTQVSGSHKFQVTAEIGEPVKVQKEEEARKVEVTQQNKSEKKEQPEKPKRSRKTIEQEIADLDAKRQKLMEKKRTQEAHAKIVFGGAVIALLKNLRENKDPLAMKIVDQILNFANKNSPKDIPILLSITDKIRDMEIK